MKKNSLLIDGAGGIGKNPWIKRLLLHKDSEFPINGFIVEDVDKDDITEEANEDDVEPPGSAEVYFRSIISFADTLEKFIKIEEFVENNDKNLLRGIAYGNLLCILGDEKSTDFEIACAYYITGLCYNNPSREYVCFRTACDFLICACADNPLYETARKKQESAKQKITLDDALRLNQ